LTGSLRYAVLVGEMNLRNFFFIPNVVLPNIYGIAACSFFYLAECSLGTTTISFLSTTAEPLRFPDYKSVYGLPCTTNANTGVDSYRREYLSQARVRSLEGNIPPKYRLLIFSSFRFLSTFRVSLTRLSLSISLRSFCSL
jgi:hypothetical protein